MYSNYIDLNMIIHHKDTLTCANENMHERRIVKFNCREGGGLFYQSMPCPPDFGSLL